MSNRRRRTGISKAKGYRVGIFTADYDLLGMVNAFGTEFVHWLIDELKAGRKDLDKDIRAWSAHLDKTNDFRFHKYRHRYGSDAHQSSTLNSLLNV